MKAEFDSQRAVKDHERALELRKLEMEFEEKKMMWQHAHEEHMATLRHGSNQGSSGMQSQSSQSHFTQNTNNETLFTDSSFQNAYTGLFDP